MKLNLLNPSLNLWFRAIESLHSYIIWLGPDPDVNVLYSVLHLTVAVIVQSVAEALSDLFSQLAVVISFCPCDQIAAVIEASVSVCGNGHHTI